MYIANKFHSSSRRNSQYQLKAGDKVEWVYTCDWGKDVGGENSARNGK